MREFYSFLTACLCWAVLSGTIFAQPSVDGYFTPDAARAVEVSAADVTIAAESVKSDDNAKSTDLSAVMDLSLTVAAASGAMGDVVCVPVTVNNFTGINSLQFSINYDATKLQFQSFANFIFGPVTTQNFNTSAPGQSRFIWSDPNADGETLPGGTVLFEICFTVTGSGTSTVAITGNPVAVEASDVPGNLVTVTTNNGVFTGPGGTGGGGGGGGGSTNLTVTIANATGNVGDVVCVPVTVNNFTGVNSLQFSINYNASRLQFQSFMNFAFGPVTTQNFNTSAPGQSRFIWSDPNADGETLASGATLFEICFTVISGGTSTVALTGNPVAIEASDVPGNLLTVTTNNGVFTGSGSGGGGGGGGSTNLTVTIADATGNVGDVVCVPVTVDNFTGINSLQFSINYDASRLQFQSFMNFAFGPVTTQNFNTSAPGQSRFIWSDPNADGETLANGATLFEICFTVTAGGSSTVSLTGNPVAIEASDVPGNLLTVDTNNGIFSGSGSGGGGGGGSTNLTVTVSNATGAVGSVVCVPVTVNNFTGINSLQFSINYDASRLQFQSFMNFAFGPVTTQNFNTSAPGQSRFIWSDPNADGETLANGATLFEICFTVIAAGSSTISITGNPVQIEASDVPGNLVTVDTNNGIFSNSGGGGGGGTNLMLNVLNATGNVGDVVCVPVTVTNFTNIRSLKFSLNYDVSRLQFQSFQSFALGTVSTPTFTNNGPGQASFNWTKPGAGGETLAAGATLFEICFTVVNGGSSTISVTNTPVTVGATNATGGAVNVTSSNGIFTGVGMGGGSTDLTVSIGPGSGAVGDVVCLNVTVNNFTNINSLQFSINYDPSVLQFQSFQNFAFGPVTTQNFNTSAPGQSRFIWSDPNADGETLPNGSTLFRICFTITNAAETTVGITGIPIAIEASNVAGMQLPVVTNSGTINSGSVGGPTYDELSFVITSTGGGVGEQVCLDVQVFNFTGVNSVQFSVNYPSAGLTFVQASNFAFGPVTTQNFNNSAPGVIRFIWADPNADGETLTDGSVFFTLCFTVNNTNPNSVSITSNPIVIEASDVAGNQLPVDVFSGTINGTGSPTFTATVKNPTCNGDGNGSIALNVNSASSVTYTWSNNVASGPTANNLSAGTYTVTVTNSNTGQQTVESYTLTNPPVFNVSNPMVTGITCNGSANGAISLTASGGVTPYVIDWSSPLPDGQLTQTNLGPGSYSVTITDANGCQRSFPNIGVSQPNPLNITGGVVNIGDNPGMINVTVSGGTPSYTYLWSGPAGYSNTTQDLGGLNQPGTYCLTVTDSRGCTRQQCFAVDRDLRVTFEVTPTCATGNTGAIDLTVTGGDGNYDYTWTNAAGTVISVVQDVSGLAAGIYNVVV
ncbi:MAG: cohesin domain-containing protein, partial [Saprospiraceae bacterium]